MKSFLRENPTIAFGLGLPLLLVVVFLIVSGIPSLLVDPPKYDVLYTTGHNNYRNTAQISVVEQKVQVIQHEPLPGDQWPQLWRYSSATCAVKEIAIIWAYSAPAPGQNSANQLVRRNTVINVPELDGLTVDSSSIAPDGYEFRARSGRSGNAFGGLFYSSRYNNEAVLVKDVRRVRLPNVGNRYYYGNSQFVGWVLEQ